MRSLGHSLGQAPLTMISREVGSRTNSSWPAVPARHIPVPIPIPIPIHSPIHTPIPIPVPIPIPIPITGHVQSWLFGDGWKSARICAR
jgi:hypothetical protein